MLGTFSEQSTGSLTVVTDDELGDEMQGLIDRTPVQAMWSKLEEPFRSVFLEHVPQSDMVPRGVLGVT